MRLALLLILAVATPAIAQQPSLARVDSLANAGALDAARAQLVAWRARNGDVAGSAHALYLSGRLAVDFRRAEPHYLAVSIGHPTSDFAPQALLRLGQGLLAAGESARAAGYLERLVMDYPVSAERARAYLWLARARRSAGDVASACRAARDGLAAAREPAIARLLRVETADCR